MWLWGGSLSLRCVTVPLLGRAEFDQLLAKAGEQLVVVNFTAAWCGPCQKIKPKFLDMAREFAHVLFLVVDVDLNHETAAAVRVHVCACDGDE